MSIQAWSILMRQSTPMTLRRRVQLAEETGSARAEVVTERRWSGLRSMSARE